MRNKILPIALLLALLATRGQAQAPGWFVIPGNYQYSATLVAGLVVDSVLRTDVNTLAVFVGNEVRGVGQTIPGSGGLFVITIYSNQVSGEALTLKTYLTTENQVHPVQETFTFQANQTYGSVSSAQVLTVWTDGDVPISLDPIPAQQAIRPNNFASLDLAPYLNQSDDDPVVWSATAGPGLSAAVNGSILSVTPTDTTWTGTGTVTVKATEQTTNQYMASRPVQFTRLPGFYEPAWDSIPSQAIAKDESFANFDLDDYIQSSYQGNCLDYSFSVRPGFAGGSDPAPTTWNINPSSFTYSMNVTGQAVFSSGYTFSNAGDRLAAFSGDQLAGVASPTAINGRNYYFLTIYSNTLSNNLKFKFYSVDKQKLYDIAGSLPFQANASIGTVAQPHPFDAAPLRLTENPGNIMSVTRLDTAWTGYLTFDFAVAECSYPALSNDTIAVNFSVGLVEICDYIDNDYDMHIDEGLRVYFYRDADGDGYGDPDVDTIWCTAPDGYITDNSDCDDSDAAVNPAATEFCDDIDNDCDGLLDNDDPSLVDIVNPVPACKSHTAYLDASGNAAITGADIDDGSSDACGIDTLAAAPDAFTCANTGANTVTLTVTDNNGNTSSCTATVTVLDTVKPQALCKDISVNLDASGSATVSGAAINDNSADACGISTLAANPGSFTCANTGANTVTLTVTDNKGNTNTCTSTVTVSDATPPSAQCKPVTVVLDAAGAGTLTAAQVDNGSSDNCGATLAISKTTFNCANVGANTVTLTVTDPSGNSSTCTSTVTVSDNTLPTAVCKAATVQLNAGGQATLAASQVNNGSSDICGIGGLAVSPNAFTCANTGANTVTLTVTDVNGNTKTCTATVTVQDQVAPAALCKAATVQLNAAGNGTLTTAQVNNNSTDNCGAGALTFTLSKTGFNCSNVGANTVTLTAKDASNNTSSCTATVTVVDGVAPVALCKNVTLSLDASGQAALTAAQVNNNSTDACGIGNLSVSPASFTCANIGGNTAQLTVSDVNGNFSSCSALVTVTDNTPPVLACQPLAIMLDNNGNANILPIQIYNAAASSDNCGTVNLVSATPSQFDCGEVGANTVTLVANDGKGNTATCTATVTVGVVYPSVSQQVTPETCGASAGSITLSVAGSGSSNQVAYSIDGGSTWQFTGVFSNVSSGVYTVVVNAPGLYGCQSLPQSLTVPATGATTLNTWTGGSGGPSDSSWGNPANWSLGAKPTFCHDVVVPAGFLVVVPPGLQAVGSTLDVGLNGGLTTEGNSTLTIQKL